MSESPQPPQDQVEPQQKSVEFSEFFPFCYDAFITLLKSKVKNGSKVLDIGCGKGNAERMMSAFAHDCTITGVDSEEASLQTLRVERQAKLAKKNNQLQLVCEDANDFLESAKISGQNTVFLQAVLHEINDPADRENYLNGFFNNVSRILVQGGNLIIGDYYYEDSVSDSEVEAFMEYQQSQIGHADSRDKFVTPDEILPVAEQFGFKLSEEGLREMPAVGGIDRKYYLMCLINEGAGDGK